MSVDRPTLKACIKPGTSEPMVEHILFTNHHHYSHLDMEQSIQKLLDAKDTPFGDCIDYDKFKRLFNLTGGHNGRR